MASVLYLASRGSNLALTQSRSVARLLEARHPGLRVEIQVYKTKGDRVLDVALAQIGSKGLFTKELEEALLDGRAQLAVHSLKDMPTELPAGLCLAAIPEREDARDALVTRDGAALADLPAGARVGTSSLRRVAQLRHVRPDLCFTPLRGNVDTRLARLDAGVCDALVIAAAGLQRLGYAGRISERLDPAVCLPAVGQGALAVEARAGDPQLTAWLAPLQHRPTVLATAAERAFLAAVQGGCQVPAAAYAGLAGDVLQLQALVAAPDGRRLVRRAAAAALPDDDAAALAAACALGRDVAAAVLSGGGAAILAELRAEPGAEL